MPDFIKGLGPNFQVSSVVRHPVDEDADSDAYAKEYLNRQVAATAGAGGKAAKVAPCPSLLHVASSSSWPVLCLVLFTIDPFHVCPFFFAPWQCIAEPCSESKVGRLYTAGASRLSAAAKIVEN